MTESSLREQWLDRLKSGTVGQVNGVLRGSNDTVADGRCCIGVAADILAENGLGEWSSGTFYPSDEIIPGHDSFDDDLDEFDTELPDFLLEKFDVTLEEQRFAIRLNDGFQFLNEEEDYTQVGGFPFTRVVEFFEDPNHPTSYGPNIGDIDTTLYKYLIEKGWVE